MRRGRPSELVLIVSVDFWSHPKGAALNAHERDQWLRILAEQLKARNGAELPFGNWGLSRERVRRYVEVGLLDEVGGRLVIHNWDAWNGRDAYKRFLARQRKRRQRGRDQDDE